MWSMCFFFFNFLFILIQVCKEEKSLDGKYLSFLRDAFTVGLPLAWVDVFEEVAANTLDSSQIGKVKEVSC